MRLRFAYNTWLFPNGFTRYQFLKSESYHQISSDADLIMDLCILSNGGWQLYLLNVKESMVLWCVAANAVS